MNKHNLLSDSLNFLFGSNQLVSKDVRKLKAELALHSPTPTEPVVMKTRRGKLKVKGNPAFTEYQKRVHALTKLQPISTLPNYEKRGFNAYHLDHKVSIYSGFKDSIPAEQIAHIDNLQMIPYKENMAKGCSNAEVR